MIKLIVAVSENGVFGNSKTNKLPWSKSYPEDMKFFRQMTAGSAIVSGRKTFESIGKPLPKRRNIVISRNKVNVEGIETFSSLKEATESAQSSHEDVFLIGGESIYREGLDLAQKLYLTMIPETITGDGLIYFPWINPSKFNFSGLVPIVESNSLNVAIYDKI